MDVVTQSISMAQRENGFRSSARGLRLGLTGAAFLAFLWLLPGCPATPADPELKKDLEAIRAEIKALKEKLAEIETGQKALLEQLKSSTAASVSGAPLSASPTVSGAQAASPLTIPELLKNKDKLLGTRVTVRGVPGPVVMHKKTLFLSGPGGMVEVIYGNLQDQKQVERLTSQAIETPITVSGILSATPGQTKEMTRLTIMADTVEF